MVLWAASAARRAVGAQRHVPHLQVGERQRLVSARRLASRGQPRICCAPDTFSQAG